MVEINCPACGAAGRAPKEKIHTRLVCKKCLKVFHMTPSGKTVSGEPPATGQTSIAGSHEAGTPDSTQKVDQWLDQASKRFSSPKTLMLAVGVVLLAVLAAFFSSRREESLAERVSRAARAAVEGDLRTVRELAASGTEIDLDAWYLSIRPQCEELAQRMGSNKLAVDWTVKQQMMRRSSARWSRR